MKMKSSDFPTASADGYERMIGRFSRILAPKFLDVARPIDAGQILDAGCGTGALTAELYRRTSTAQLVGFDISKIYIEHARRIISDDRVRFQVADIRALPFPDENFDQIFSQITIDLLSNSEIALSELFRVLKPRGMFATSLWVARSALGFIRIFLDTAAVLDTKADDLRKVISTRPLRKPEYFRGILTSIGFTDISRNEIMFWTDFASFDDYWSFFDGRDGPIPAYLSERPLALRAQIKDAVRRAYLDGEDDGLRSYVAVAQAICARRPA